MALNLVCDECGEIYYQWVNGRAQNVPPQMSLWRKHECPKCRDAMDEAMRELSGWAGIEKDKLSAEYEKRVRETFNKHRGK